jgi:hypothetical protein
MRYIPFWPKCTFQHYADQTNFAVVYISDLDLFYLFPVEEFISYGSEIHLVEADKRQRRPRSASFRDAWELMVEEAARRQNDDATHNPTLVRDTSIEDFAP